MTDNNTKPAIDQTILDVLREVMGEEDFAPLIPAFLESTTDMLEQMPRAYASADHATLERLAHSTKSASANIGAMVLSEQARSLEAALRQGESIDVTQSITSMEAEFQRVRDELLRPSSVESVAAAV